MFKVPTLDISGSTSSFTVRTYDVETMLVLERNYDSTTTVDAVTFDGDLSNILRETDIVTAERFVYTDPVTISINVPSNTRLMLTPSCENKDILFSVKELEFLYNWNKSNEIQFGVPSTVGAGRYEIKWTKA
jgi:hypothetical protein